MIYYSCDSHVVEAPEVFLGMEGRFGERAPQVLKDPGERPGTFLKLGQVPVPVGLE